MLGLIKIRRQGRLWMFITAHLHGDGGHCVPATGWSEFCEQAVAPTAWERQILMIATITHWLGVEMNKPGQTRRNSDEMHRVLMYHFQRGDDTTIRSDWCHHQRHRDATQGRSARYYLHTPSGVGGARVLVSASGVLMVRIPIGVRRTASAQRRYRCGRQE